MISAIAHRFKDKQIVLASSSPRRVEILKQSGLEFQVVPSNVCENISADPQTPKGDIALAVATRKCEAVLKDLWEQGKKPDIVISADTIVCLTKDDKDIIFGKPKDADDAFMMLAHLNDETHQVYTGVCIAYHSSPIIKDLKDYQCEKFYECTNVTFASHESKILQAYVATNEPMDKAGGYGIQGIGGSLIKKIDGDYYNVMGLPFYQTTYRLYRIMQNVA